MGDPPLPAYSPAGLPGREATPPPVSLSRSTPKEPSDNLALLGVLRQALAAGTQSTDSILQAIADAARILSGAHGTALAVRVNGAIVCRARSGEVAPPLGVALDSDSGISGECLRTATTMVCWDAALDARVDAEACLSLGVRSIVAVPLRGRLGMLGILEAFSAWPGAFGEEQINSLRSLAEIAETACERERRTQAAVAVSKAPAKDVAALPVVSKVSPVEEIRELPEERSSKRKYWIAGIVALSLVLLSAVAWMSWRQTARDIAASDPIERPASTSGTTNATAVPSAVKRDAVTVHPAKPLPVGALLQNAAEVHTVTDKPAGRHAGGNSTIKDDKGEAKRTILLPVPARPPSEAPPPSVELAASNPPDDLARSATESATMPQLGARVSQGIIEAKLIHKVAPEYPAEARRQGITGSVILDATIAEDGSVRALKVIDGPSLLSASAAVAVRQWKYTPAILNGNAIEAQKRITVNFKLP